MVISKICLVYPSEFDSASFNQTFANEKDCYKINSLGPYRSPQKVITWCVIKDQLQIDPKLIGNEHFYSWLLEHLLSIKSISLLHTWWKKLLPTVAWEYETFASFTLMYHCQHSMITTLLSRISSNNRRFPAILNTWFYYSFL